MNIALGFELKTGRAVSIPLRHLAVIGRTQDSGKTTTLEALILRSNLRALAFVTKRGEQSFTSGQIVDPFFQEPSNDGEPLWQFVSSLLETAVGEKLRMQRSSIMRVCDVSAHKKMAWAKPRTLAQVAANVETALGVVRSGFEESMFRQLREYFRMVLPQIERLPKTPRLELRAGLNIMYLDNLSEQMQSLCMGSCMEWNRRREHDTVTIVPEAWKFMGQGHASPALHAAKHLIREGGVLKNLLWADSQDLVGIDAEIRKQIGVWILGVQGEAIEAERTIKQLPSEFRKLKTHEVQQLRVGQFFVSWGEGTRVVYVQPSWLTAEAACMVAMGAPTPARPGNAADREDEMWREQAEKAQQRVGELEKELKDAGFAMAILKGDVAKLRKELADSQSILRSLQSAGTPIPAQEALSSGPSPKNDPSIDNRQSTIVNDFDPESVEAAHRWYTDTWPLVRDEILKEPGVIKLLASEPEIQVSVARQILNLSNETLLGKLAGLLADGFFDRGANGSQAFVELKRRGASVSNPNVYRELDKLSALGFLTKEQNGDSKQYLRVSSLKVTKHTIETDERTG